MLLEAQRFYTHTDCESDSVCR